MSYPIYLVRDREEKFMTEKKLLKVKKLPKVDEMTTTLAMVFAGDEEDYPLKYPQWALDEEKELYGTTVIDRVGAGLVYATYEWCKEDEGLTEEQAVEAVRNRILFNKFMD